MKHTLGSTIIEVRLADAGAAERAKGRLEPVGATEVLEDGRTVALTVGDAGQAVLEVVRSLDAAGLTPDWLTVREPTLDDVFLQLTGHKAEDSPPGDEAQATGARPRRGEARRGEARRGEARHDHLPTGADTLAHCSKIGWAIKDALAVAKRNLIGLFRTPTTLVFSTMVSRSSSSSCSGTSSGGRSRSRATATSTT